MNPGYAAQYATRCIIVDKDNRPTAAALIEACRDLGAVFYEDGPDDECFVVDTGRGVGPELYTERALVGSFK